MDSAKNWKVIDLLNTTTDFFKQKNIDSPRLNAERLLAFVLKTNRVNLYVNFERPLTSNELNLMRSLVKRRMEREPLQYIIGETEFMGLPFKVNRHVLIPRPETEILVENVLEFKQSYKSPQILDIGCGSGCIPLSIANYWPEAKCYALDISENAIEVCKQNADLNNLKLETYTHNIFNSWPGHIPDKFDFIVSNPPYIAKNEMAALEPEILNFEPEIALTDQADGMSFYQRIFQLLTEKILQTGHLFLELSGSQTNRIKEIAGKLFSNVAIHKDLNQIERVMHIRFN